MMSYGKDDPTDMDSLENTRRATAEAVHREIEAERAINSPPGSLRYAADTIYAEGEVAIFPDHCIYQSQFDENINNDLTAMQNMVKFWEPLT